MIKKIKLSEFFSLFPPTYLLGTSYTLSLAFFESEVFPHVYKKNLLKCLIICDQYGFKNAISEAAALREASKSYIAIYAPTIQKFHPKVWLMMSDDRVALLVGSGNLTQSGFVKNVELFDVVEISSDQGSQILVEDILQFLKGLNDSWSEISERSGLIRDSLKEMLNLMESFKEIVPVESEKDIRFLSSFGGSISEQLKFFGENSNLFVATPYFGGSLKGLSLLIDSLQPRSTRVYPLIDQDGTTDLPIDDISSLPNTSISSIELNKQSVFSHFKLYGFLNDKNGKSWLFNSSSNCTRAALEAENIEAGLLRQVSPSIIQTYFKESKTEFKAKFKADEYTSPSEIWLRSWATDIGDKIEIVASSSDNVDFPLHDVSITLKIGNRQAQIKKDELFASENIEEISWKSFPDLSPQSSLVCILFISGFDQKEKKVVSSCLVNDFIMLTSNPEHRSAWRGVINLLDDDAIPVYQDIIAIFNLLDGILEKPHTYGEVGEEQEELNPSKHRPAKRETEDLIPLWPPIPISKRIKYESRDHRFASIYWFQRILEAFISSDQYKTERGQRLSNEETKDKSTTEKEPFEITEEAKSRFEKIWEQANISFDTLERRLKPLIITEKQANKIWFVSIAILLANLSIRKVIYDASKGGVEVPMVSEVLTRFISLLFNDREQHSDYARPEECRYAFRIFPPIVEDLQETFNITPHPDLFFILICLFSYLKACSLEKHKLIFPLNSWLQLIDILGDKLDCIDYDKKSIQKISRRYFTDELEGITWDRISSLLEQIKDINWKDHTGYRDLLLLIKIANGEPVSDNDFNLDHIKKSLDVYKLRLQRGGANFFRVSRFIEYCQFPECPRAFITQPTISKLRNLSPVICEGCGSVLIPDRLYDVSKGFLNE